MIIRTQKKKKKKKKKKKTGGESLVKSLAKNAVLETLDLSSSGIGHATSIQLFSLLQKNKSLKNLNVACADVVGQSHGNIAVGCS